MAKAKKKSAPTKESNVLLSVTLKDHNGNDMVVDVPKDYKCECEKKGASFIMNDGECFLVRVDNIYELIGAMEADVYSIYYSHADQIYCDEWKQEEDGNYRPMSKVELFNIALEEFKIYGYLYRYVGYDYMPIADNLFLRTIPKGYKIVQSGAEVFTAKYAVGSRAFYHNGSSENITASKIDTVVVKHKCGYNVSIDYVMSDGRTVKEDSIILKDKALEWVNARG